MIDKIGDMKLRSKMIICFQFVILIMSIALFFGINGMQKNKKQFVELKLISDEQMVAMNILRNLSESRMYYESFLVKSNDDTIRGFKEKIEKMQEYSGYYKSMSVQDERINYMKGIEKDIELYEKEFDNIVKQEEELNKLRIRWFDDGDNMLANVRYMEDIAINEDEVHDKRLFSNLSKSLEYILNARLVAFKYYTFKESERFDEFKQLFGKLDSYMGQVKDEIENTEFLYSYNEFKRYRNDYEACMEQMREIFFHREASVKLMGKIAPDIEEKTKFIIDSVNNEKDRHIETANANHKRNITWMVLITALSFLFSIVAVRVLIRIIITPLKHITETFSHISKGDANLEFRLDDKKNDEIGIMAKEFNKFMIKLKSIMNEIREQNWIKTAETDMTELLAGKEDINDISQSTIEYLCECVNGQIGAIYVNEEDQYLLKGHYACNENISDSIKSGEGLLGQCIADKKVKVISKLPAGYITAGSSLGMKGIRNLVLIPCLHEGEVAAVVEIGTFKDVTSEQRELFQVVSKNIGVTIFSAMSNSQIKELLELQTKQSQTLQAQQEELRQNNEELEEQTRVLIESEKQLQAQKEELKVSNEELEVRTEELEQQKKEIDKKNSELENAKRSLEHKADDLSKANKYKSEFLANMSHELRTPLNSILVLSQLLNERGDEKPLSKKEKEFAKAINSSGQELLSIINDILDLSKVEAGYLEVKFDEVYLTDILEYNSGLFAPLAESKGISFSSEIEKDADGIIISDELRVNQIVRNLLSNAVKFTESGGVNLNIRVAENNEIELAGIKEDAVAIEVIDTGIGIPDSKKDVIFEAFRQSDGTTSRKYGGTGLGLTISRELTGLLNGKIIMESEYGKGSKFALIIPRGCLREDEVREKVVNEVCGTRENTIDSVSDNISEKDKKVGREKLLIIEDDEVFAGVLQELAVQKGLDVIVANNGKDGIEMAVENEVSAVILDLGLPDMEGKKVAEELRKIEKTENIPIHVISGKEEGIELSENIIGYLKKPVDIKTIYETLGKIEEYTDNLLKKFLVVGECGGEEFEHFSDLADIEIVKVKSGEEGIHKIKEDKYECVIMDIKIDDMTGKEFVETINQEMEDEHNKIPLIIYTDESYSEEKFNEIEKDVKTIILKSPKSKERLIDEISGFIENVSDVKINSNFPGNMEGKKSQKDSKYKEIKVLVVDDDERNIYALSNLLESRGLKVLSAENGDECIEVLEKEKDIELIFMDIMMPVRDGWETTKLIREKGIKTKKNKEIPIVALTAKVMKEDIEMCMEAGANYYLSKPIEVEKLNNILKVWMDEK